MSEARERYFSILIIAFITVHFVQCDIGEDVRIRVTQLRDRSRRLYGDSRGGPAKQWELDGWMDDEPYPNGDKQRLAEASHHWIEHYQCLARLAGRITVTGHLPSANVAVYAGGVARVQCGLCVPPGKRSDVTWTYAESIHNLTFVPLSERSTVVAEQTLTIYNTQLTDAGVYRCGLGGGVGGLAVLEVLDDQEYQHINTSFEDTNSSFQSTCTAGLVAFRSWSAWSECSLCGCAGARRRYGLCCLRLPVPNDQHGEKSKDGTAPQNASILKLFEEFPQGITCGSKLLPSEIRSDPVIDSTNNIIQTEACQVPCTEVFEIRSQLGALLERANNSAGVFSLAQTPPPQPAPPGRELVFVKPGDAFKLVCPGTTLRDVPTTWRKGIYSSQAADYQAWGRVGLNGRDQIVFASVKYGDAGVYSCWQGANLAGVVKVEVARAWGAERPAAILAVALLLLAAARLLRIKIRHAQ